jgi:hypothetical protein
MEMNSNQYIKEVLQDRIDWLTRLMKEAAIKGITADISIRMEKIEILKKHIEELGNEE